MIITILTLFPEVFIPLFQSSIIGRALKKKLVKINIVNIRDFSSDKRRSVDDRLYGGGVGMLLRVDILDKAITSVKLKKKNLKEKVILLDPKGKIYTQKDARIISKLDHLILICGHYEGVDARINHFVDESLSIGQYVLSGGEVPAMVIADSVIRLIPNVLRRREAVIQESFSRKNILEYLQYTRPANYKSFKVPEVLLSGNHKKIASWREKPQSGFTQKD